MQNKICAIRQKKAQEDFRSQEGGSIRRMTNFIICFSSQIFDYDRDPVTEDKMGGARATHGKERQCTKGFGWSTGKNKTA
jgi:hypothetical protein